MILWEQVANTSLIEWFAVVFAIGYVVLAAKQIIWCWPCAFISTALYTYLFWQVSLPFQSLLNLYYMGMAIYGVWQWNKAKDDNIVVKTMPTYWHILLLPSALIVSWVMSQLFSEQFSTNYLLLDGFINFASMVTTLLVANKYLENWLYWIVINSLSAWLYWQSGLHLSSLLFGVYVGFAVYGYIQWKEYTAETGIKGLSNSSLR